MIFDLRTTEISQVNTRIAIIGAGAAGLTLALELSNHFKDVVVLESGGLDFEQATQNLYDGVVLGHETTDLAISRLRFFGGSTNHWEGLCSRLDAVDFERLPDRPLSGWPFTLAELEPFYKKAYSYCQLGTYNNDMSLLEQVEPTTKQILDGPGLPTAVVRHSPPTRFGQQFRPEVARSDRIKIYLHANVTDIVFSPNRGAVTSVDVHTLTGRRINVAAQFFILCCGGIENPRILLNCSRTFPTGVGNEHDLVGRFFMDHLLAEGGVILPRNERFDLGPLLLRGGRDGDVPVTVVFRNSADAVRSQNRNGCSIFLDAEYEDSQVIAQARSSRSFNAIRDLIHDVEAGRIPQQFQERGCTALEDPRSVATALYYRLLDPVGKTSGLKAVIVRLTGEQLPNASSRVVLTEKVDALGMKKAGLDWRISDKDYDSLFATAMACAQGVGASGFGRMRVKQRDEIAATSGWHHMGTTKMHDDPKKGVVDRNCRVHNIDNFFIAGSSVFPTGSRVHPTLTIVALAIRLADHLKAKNI